MTTRSNDRGLFGRRLPGGVPAAALAVLWGACAGTTSRPAAVPPAGSAATAAVGAAPALPPAPSGATAVPIQPMAAPFSMPDLQRPTFPAARFDVRSFGAIADGKTKNTEAFRRAVQAAATAGGGHVVVPAGRWLTGPIHLESHISLDVEAGAEILFSQEFEDYLPVVLTRWEGLEVYNYSPLVYAHDCTDVAVTGAGKLDGQGQPWWPWKKKQEAGARRLYEMAVRGVPVKERLFGTEEAALRPSFIQTMSCKNVLIEGVTITNGPMWTIHPVYSENVIVRGVTVLTEGPNNDGCNPDSTRNMLIEDTYFSTGDDCIVIKSGLNEDGWRVGRPTENVVIRRVRGTKGHGGVAIGSEMSGGVRNVYVHDCDFSGVDRGLRIKSMRGRGASVENVWYEKVKHWDLRKTVVELTTFYDSSTLVPRTQRAPTFRNIHIKDIGARGAKQAISVVGLPELPIRDVTFDGVDIVSGDGVHCVDAEGVKFDRVKITPEHGPAFSLENSQRISIDHSCTVRDKACLVQSGERTRQITVDGVPWSSDPAAERR